MQQVADRANSQLRGPFLRSNPRAIAFSSKKGTLKTGVPNYRKLDARDVYYNYSASNNRNFFKYLSSLTLKLFGPR